MIRRPPRSTRTDSPFPYTTRFRSQDAGNIIIGIDEAGRAPLAGPVTAGAVWLDRGRLDPALACRIDDSKKLTPQLRSTIRSEEHTSELQSLMRNSYAVFCLNKTTTSLTNYDHNIDLEH